MPRLALALAIHNHQPVGNFDEVFERGYRRAYEPMVAALERHPGIRLALHYSGPLLDWIGATHPGLLARLRGLVARGQIEIMTGGYYEPILPIIPDRDKHGQILMMTRIVRDLFGYDPTGLWLAERVWEPHLPKALAAAGIRYTITDDTHFHHVGMTDDELVGHFITEEEGATVGILPSAKALRYRVPWAPVEEVMAYLRSQVQETSRVVVMGDDGEKFGLWPGTDLLCWERGWIDAFFGELERAGDWLEVLPPGEWVRREPPRGRAYLPTASYDEMTEWALPAAASARLPALKHELEGDGRADLLPFLQGGFWRHFLVKYPEVNTLHKTMLRVSRRVWRMRPGARRDAALEHLWKAQCNCPYWHGVFGGIYLAHIRAANYRHLIAAERLADAGRRTRPWVEASIDDLDADGRPEVLVRSAAQVLTLDPAEGGGVVAWHAREAGVNLINVMTRRAEGYHAALRQAIAGGEVALAVPDQVETIHTTRIRVKEWGLERHLVTDWYRRSSFLDHFLAPGGMPEAFLRGEIKELGDFVNQPYDATVEYHLPDAPDAAGVGNPQPEEGRGRARARVPRPEAAAVRLVRRGHVWIEGEHAPVLVEKVLVVPAAGAALEVTYRLANMSGRTLAADFAVETNWGLTSPTARLEAGGDAFPAGAATALPGLAAFTLREDGWGRELLASIEGPIPNALWIVPIEVVSASEAGYERTLQGASVLPVWRLRLGAGETWEARLLMGFEPPAAGGG